MRHLLISILNYLLKLSNLGLATANACTINDEQLVKKNKKLKEKLASSQDDDKKFAR